MFKNKDRKIEFPDSGPDSRLGKFWPDPAKNLRIFKNLINCAGFRTGSGYKIFLRISDPAKNGKNDRRIRQKSGPAPGSTF